MNIVDKEELKSNPDTLLELYKLHAELADGLSNSRLYSSKLYTGFIATIFTIQLLIYRWAPCENVMYSEIPGLMKFGLPIIGVLMSVTWVLSIFNTRAVLQSKNEALQELEVHLPIRFYEKELEKFRSLKAPRNWAISVIMPFAFLAVCVVWGIQIFVSEF